MEVDIGMSCSECGKRIPPVLKIGDDNGKGYPNSQILWLCKPCLEEGVKILSSYKGPLDRPQEHARWKPQ